MAAKYRCYHRNYYHFAHQEEYLTSKRVHCSFTIELTKWIAICIYYFNQSDVKVLDVDSIGKDIIYLQRGDTIQLVLKKVKYLIIISAFFVLNLLIE